MVGVIITGGEAPPAHTVREVARGADLVVAADSGYDTASEAGVEPDLVVGDFDSISELALSRQPDGEKVLRYPRNKDETDTEIAVRTARERGCSEIVIVGGGGGRMSHFVGILWMFDRPDPPQLWLTGDAEFQCVAEGVTIFGEIGEQVSFFPAGTEECRMSSTGLRWPLNNVSWKKGDIGVSNEFAKRSATIRVESGRLLMVRDRVWSPG